jgi:hypothetical protein
LEAAVTAFVVYFQRKQKDVSKENEFYMQLLQQALPVEQQQTQQALPQQQQQQQQSCHNTSPERSRGKAFIGLLLLITINMASTFPDAWTVKTIGFSKNL